LFARLLRGAGLVRLAIASSKARERAKASRMRADALRDRGAWAEAAGQYRAYLSVHPNNAGIWIQLGHMLKESLQYDRAESAYKRALMLSPADADGHVQLGHLRQRQGRMYEAAASYVRAAKIDPLSYASVELRKPEMQAYLHGDAGELSSAWIAATYQGIESRCEGLSITAAHGVFLLEGDEGLQLETGDPWLEFALHHESDARFGRLRFDIEWIDAEDDHVPHNRFYVDYGDGYSEELTLNVVREDGWVNDLLIAAPATIRALRWDPDSQPNKMKLLRLAYSPIESREEVREWLEQNPYDPREGDIDPPDFEAFIDAETVTGEDAAAMQYRLPTSFDKGFNYPYWWKRYIEPSEADYRRMTSLANDFALKPKFSFVMPVYNPPVEFLEACIDSMLAQNYTDFEICIADDCSPNPEIAETLQRYEAEYGDRVKICYRPRNGHISAASNSALALATGDYVVLVDHDDLVPAFALWVIAYYLNKHPDAQVIFSDEDKVSPDGRQFTPYFKTAYNPFLMYGHNMVSHIGVYATGLLREIGGFRLGYEGSQDYDLFLRAYERIRRDQVVHIPHVLYHWRAIPGSTAVSADQKGYAIYAAQAAINGYFERNDIALRSVDGFAPGCTGIKATVVPETSMSIIIPTRDGLDVLKPCIESIVARKPVKCQIIVVDNGSVEPETLEFFEQAKEEYGIEVLPYPSEFNFSAINNFAADHATGEILCFLNNDTEVVARDWLERARSLLSFPEVGMVGARLLFPDRSVQHFGIALGVGDHRIAGTPHAGFHADLPGYFGKSRLIQEFSAVTAACMFIRKRDFESIGGFDIAFRVAYNDVDLCMRLREQTGLAIVCDPEIVLIHKESRTRGSDKDGARALRLEEEASAMHARWKDKLLNDPYYSPNLSLDRVDFALAYPPRVAMPWATGTVA
jgi:GT2 family glycosyltransferase